MEFSKFVSRPEIVAFCKDPVNKPVIKKIFELYIAFLQSNPGTAKYVVGGAKFNDNIGALNIILIRRNELGQANDLIPNNDWMLTCFKNENGEYELDYYTMTVDPKTQYVGMAWLMDQVTRWQIGKHKWNPLRWALRQDDLKNGFDYRKWVKRLQNKAKNIWKEFLGFYTIHVHCNNGNDRSNTSLGCPILSFYSAYVKYFRPLLKKVSALGQGKNVPGCVMSSETFVRFANEALKTITNN